MKLVRALFLLVFGMIASTALGSTTMPEAKQKAAIVKDYHVSTTVADVLYLSVESYDVAVTVRSFESSSNSDNGFNPVKSFAVLTDVGWQCSKQRFKPIPYTEKLHTNYLPDKARTMQNLGVSLSRNQC